MPFKQLFFACLITLMLAACNNGTQYANTDNNKKPKTFPPVSGLYTVTFDPQGNENQWTGRALVYEGKLYIFNTTNDQRYTGHLKQVGANAIKGHLKLDTGTFKLQGTIEKHRTITGTFVATWHENKVTGQFTLDLNENLYTRDANLAKVSAVWGLKNSGMVISVTNNGHFNGTNSSHCSYTGGINTFKHHQKKNIYAVHFTITQCGDLNGSYSGFAFLADSRNGTIRNGRLVVIASTQDPFKVYQFLRQ